MKPYCRRGPQCTTITYNKESKIQCNPVQFHTPSNNCMQCSECMQCESLQMDTMHNTVTVLVTSVKESSMPFLKAVTLPCEHKGI